MEVKWNRYVPGTGRVCVRSCVRIILDNTIYYLVACKLKENKNIPPRLFLINDNQWAGVYIKKDGGIGEYEGTYKLTNGDCQIINRCIAAYAREVVRKLVK